MLFRDVKINYQDEGVAQSKATIVFLHGFMNDLDIWHYYLVDYMQKVRVITIDLLGHGASENLSDVHSMELQADMVKAVLDNVEVKNCVIVGHSMGGYVGLAFAQKYPQYVKGLCLLHSHALSDREDEKQARNRICETLKHNKPNFILDFIPNLFAESNRERLHKDIEDMKASALQMKAESIIAAEQGMAARPSTLNILSSSNYPILFILGKKDTRIPVELALSQAMLPSHSELLLLDNVGHMSHVEKKEIVKRRLYSFLLMCYSVA